MGIESNRFNRPLSPEFICSICEDVFERPVQGSLCQHIFCEACIRTWLQRRSCCPIDRRPLTRTDLIDAPRVLRSLLGELELSCDFASNGCPLLLKLDLLSSHRKECPFNPNSAQGDHNWAIFTPRTEEGDGKVRCTSNCGAFLNPRELRTHSCLNYMMSVLKVVELENQRMQGVIVENEKLINELIKENENLKIDIKWRQAFITSRCNHELSSIRETGEKGPNQPLGLTDTQPQAQPKANITEIRDIGVGSSSLSLSTDFADNGQEGGGNGKGEDNILAKENEELRKENERMHIIIVKQHLEIEKLREELEQLLRPASQVLSEPSTSLSVQSKNKHKELIKQLKKDGIIISTKVYEAMRAVHFKRFVERSPYNRSWAEFVAKRIEKWATYVKPGYNVLNIQAIDAYQGVCCALMIGSKGSIVSVTDDQVDIERVKRYQKSSQSHAISLAKIGMVYEADHEKRVHGYAKGAPYDLIFVSYSDDAKETIRGQLKSGGILYCDWEEKVMEKKGDGALTDYGSGDVL